MDTEQRKFLVWIERYNWQIRNQEKMKKQLLINYLKKQNFEYILKRKMEREKYRKTLISGVMFMIFFTIFIVLILNCLPNI